MWSQFRHAHSACVTSLTFSPHVGLYSHLLCSTSGDETVALWDYYSGVSIARLRHHREPVNHALFLPDEPHHLLTASDDGSIALWDLRRPDHPLGSLHDFPEGVNKVILLPLSCLPERGEGSPAFPRPRYLTGSACDDGKVYLHGVYALSDAPNDGEVTFASSMTIGVLLDSFWASVSTVNDLVWIPETELLLTASEDGALRGWRLGVDPTTPPQERLLQNLDDFENPVNHVVKVPEGWMDPPAGAGIASSSRSPSPASASPPCWVLAASSEGVFGIALTAPDGAPDPDVRTFIGHGDYVRGMSFTPARTLLTVSDDRTAIEWALPTAEPIRQVQLHEGLVMASALSAAGDAFASGSDTGEIRVWRLPFQTERLVG
ncbi:unnamed protein product [Phytomonas sp. Hart1]|nr:unnamed protein product [Phytomonas sp. Hart1]|eukprot:CCW66317.1 unnamed protein product [Phytomonas sp. isolate Hart1]